MRELLTRLLAGGVGLLLGAVFFGGLWWTVRNSVASTRIGLWFLGSLLVRTSIALLGFYLVARGDWQRLVACLLGFVIARVIVIRLTRSPRLAWPSTTDAARRAA